MRLFLAWLEAGSLARKVAIPVDAGGTLELISEGREGSVGNEANQAVWGEPVLVRLDEGENAARETASGKK